MNRRLALGLGGLNLSLLAAAILSTYAPAANAQDQNIEPIRKGSGICPFGWREGGTAQGRSGIKGVCYPISSDSLRIYARTSGNEPCATGYYPETGLFCTSQKPTLVSAERSFARSTALKKPADNAGAKDFNEVHAWTLRNGGDPKAVGDSLSPAAIAWFASTAGSGSTPAADRNDAARQQTKPEPSSPCTNGAATGAAVGAVISGTSGARVGAALGSLAERKPHC
ncbi:MAG: hypothetical protein U0S50_10980 [Sphingopyxis sp.]|uniref:hypothetical protein n=1 Tax=Sphingopyxis sp. TaxID=1908224 RepID=UPI002AB9472D|nr:hypothetical protein [Sphingopyxis sp.]MDZ3832330.1 hypothetical protein [Sphingopyxis sp.]